MNNINLKDFINDIVKYDTIDNILNEYKLQSEKL
jgi:hypothetical protein